MPSPRVYGKHPFAGRPRGRIWNPPLHPLSQKWLYVERPEGRPPYNPPNKLSTTPWGVEDAAPYKRKMPLAAWLLSGALLLLN